MFSLKKLFCTIVDWSRTTRIKQWERMLFSVEQAFVERDEILAPLKRPAWKAIASQARKEFTVFTAHNTPCLPPNVFS